METLLIRADAGTQIGSGHLMRCLALAQAWKVAGGQVSLITACQNTELLQRYRDEKCTIHLIPQAYPDLGDWDNVKNILNTYPNTWVVLDGYHFDDTYEQRIRETGHKLLVIDDMADLKHYYADIVLNQNLYADQLHYSCEPHTRLLLGAQYVLLRREFLDHKERRRDIQEIAKRVLVTLGGVDAKNYTSDVMRALQKVNIPNLEVTVIIGAGNFHSNELVTIAGESRILINIVRDTNNMAELMAKTDVAICSGGTTVWELAFMGTPTISAATTTNEEILIKKVESKGLFINLDWTSGFSSSQIIHALNELLMNKEARYNMSELGRSFIDGKGCERVSKIIEDFKAGK